MFPISEKRTDYSNSYIKANESYEKKVKVDFYLIMATIIT